MNDLIQIANAELARFLGAKLPKLAADWWGKQVVERLSFQQQRRVREKGYQSLDELDFASLLRVLDQNWHELSDIVSLPKEGRSWVKELQTVRNKWAHLSSEGVPPGDIYRDADTLGRLLAIIDATQEALGAIESAKATVLFGIAKTGADSGEGVEIKEGNRISDAEHSPSASTKTPSSASLFKVGDLVSLRSNPAEIMPVIEVVPGPSECRYRVFHKNTKVTYYASQLAMPTSESNEQKTLTARELRAYLTSLQILSPSTKILFSLRSGRVHFVPYQYRPVLKLIRSDRPRLLIADEVGVGKTIEAGLIIKELRARIDISSILIICPKALVAERKWFNEMKRFDEQFTALDGPLLRHCLKETHLEGEWPEQYAKAILPFSLFDSDLLSGRQGHRKSKSQGLIDLDPPPKFDMVIVDEAHHIRNSETYLHQGVRYFCDNAAAVLFLTATPVQLGSEDLYTLLNVLRPDLVIDRASFDKMAEPNRYINAAVQHCRAAEKGWQKEAHSCLEEMAQTEWGRLFVRESPTFQTVYDQLQEPELGDKDRIGLLHSIEELYTFSPLINRTRRRDIGEFTIRKPETLTVDFTKSQRLLHDSLLELVARILTHFHGSQSVKFMMTTIRRQAASCLYGLAPTLEGILAGKLDKLELMEASDNDQDPDFSFVEQVRTDIEALLERARNLEPHDPKVEAFIKVLLEKSNLPNNKALLFSTFRHTLAYLAKHIESTGLRFGLIHGDVSDEERADLRHRFSLPKEDTTALDVLLSSEVGCEGLDFQFCDFLINYDLPWNPMRIEQRIGRIDRYGQKSKTVAIVNLITPGTVDADIYNRCLWRIGVFQHAVGGNEEILGQITRKIHDIAESFSLTEGEREQRLRQLADNSIRQIREEQELESKQAELFGLNVPSQDWRQELEAATSEWLSPSSIQRCVGVYLAARLGTDVEHFLGEKALKTLRLSQEARTKLVSDYKQLPTSTEPVAREWEKWLKGGSPTLSVTFEQEMAAESPKAAHLSVLHPLVRQAARFLELDEPVYVSLDLLNAEVTPGNHQFVVYRWKKQGVRSDEVLIPVASNSTIEHSILSLLQSAEELRSSTRLLNTDEFDALEAQHYQKWSVAQANHIAENRQTVEHRKQSLIVSHRARCAAIEEQISRATNPKIRLMKQSELDRAVNDFKRRMEVLQEAANSGDIHARPVIFGTITIAKPGGA